MLPQTFYHNGSAGPQTLEYLGGASKDTTTVFPEVWKRILDPLAGFLPMQQQEPLGACWAVRSRSSHCMDGLHRTIWYELQARDWPFKNQAAEALIWQVGSGEGMKRVLASVSLGKEVTVSSHVFLERAEGL